MDTSITQYVNHLGCFFELHFPGAENVARSALTKRLVKAVCRHVARPKNRARPITLDELRHFARTVRRNYPGQRGEMLAFVAILAFWGCLRLGTILQPKAAELDVVRWSDVYVCYDAHGPHLIVYIYRDKTLNAASPVHPIRIDNFPGDLSVCAVAACKAAQALAAHHCFPLTAPIASLAVPGSPLSPVSKVDFIGYVNSILPPLPVKPLGSKRHFSGHSFRRGHVQAALALGISIEDLALFGNWKSYVSIKNYTEAATIASQLRNVLAGTRLP